MGKFRPTGVGYFNSNSNELLLDPNFDTLFAGTNLFAVETADVNLSEITSYQALLVENTGADYSWWTYSYDIETATWTNIDSDTDIGLEGIKTVIKSMPVNSMNVPCTDTDVTAIKALLGIV